MLFFALLFSSWIKVDQNLSSNLGQLWWTFLIYLCWLLYLVASIEHGQIECQSQNRTQLTSLCW